MKKLKQIHTHTPATTSVSEVHYSLLPSGKVRRRQFYSQPLENGKVLTQGSTFTYQDVLDQLLVYTPETVNGGADEMRFTLTDGIFMHTDRLEFTMDVRKSEGPRMTVNRGLQLPAGERGGKGGEGREVVGVFVEGKKLFLTGFVLIQAFSGLLDSCESTSLQL